MSIIEKRALKVSWDEISNIVESDVDQILGIKLKCEARPVESDYWDVEFIDYRMPLSKLCQVLQAVEAAPDDWETVLPNEGAVDVKDIGMRVGEKLLGKHLGAQFDRRRRALASRNSGGPAFPSQRAAGYRVHLTGLCQAAGCGGGYGSLSMEAA